MKTTIKYEGSECWKATEYNNDKEQLTNRKRHIDSAVEAHRGKDQANFDFFTKAQDHVNKKLSVRS